MKTIKKSNYTNFRQIIIKKKFKRKRKPKTLTITTTTKMQQQNTEKNIKQRIIRNASYPTIFQCYIM